MSCTAAQRGVWRAISAVAVAAWCVASAAAQILPDEFVTGAASAAWEKWQAAMKVVLARDGGGAEAAFGELMRTEPSPFRLALMAERTVMRTPEGGAVLLLEQDLAAGVLKENGRRTAEMLAIGREQMDEADDGWWFASMGRFDVADANFRALIASDPDPVALLEFADRVKRRTEILSQLVTNPVVGNSAKEILKLLEKGELLIKADPTRIKENIERLAGPPRGYANAVARLQDSGEYAIPFIVQYLRDPKKSEFAQGILRALPQIDRPALNPLVQTTKMAETASKSYLMRAIGQIGYAQGVPYLLQLKEGKDTSAETRAAVDGALQDTASKGVTIPPNLSAAEAFYKLAEEYYNNAKSLAADTRLDTANVWYWRESLLQNIEVPTAIFNEIMAMRCSEEALLLRPDYKEPLALWLAANFRREAQLPDGQPDYTRPTGYPSAAYFAQSAGAEYCLMALARAVADNDPVVAHGAIEALRKTAGPASLAGGIEGRYPLAQALSFPDRMVRIRAALALANGLPEKSFENDQNLIPVLSEALALHAGSRNALVVDPDSSTANAALAALRAEGFEVVVDARLFGGLEKVRRDLPGIDLIFVASDIEGPGLAEGLTQMRGDFRFGSTPVLIITKTADRTMVRDLVRADYRLGQIAADAAPEQVRDEVARVARGVGAKPITPELGTSLALESARALRLLAETNNPVINISGAEAALIASLAGTDSTLRATVAQVLGYLGTSPAQDAIARIALDGKEDQSMRVTMFTALAEAAKRRGSHLSDELIKQVIDAASNEPNLTLREAASQTLGALNLPGNPASEIIRNQYGG